MIRKIQNNIIYLTVILSVFYAAFLFIFDYQKIYKAIIGIEIEVFSIALGLVIVSWVLKFIKWIYILNKIDIERNRKEETNIFLSGFIMAFTPGKSGELIKANILKKLQSVDLEKGISAILIDKISEVFSLVIITICLISIFTGSIILKSIFLFIGILLLIISSSNNFYFYFLNKLVNIKYFNKYKEQIKRTSNLLSRNFRLKNNLFIYFFSFVIWVFEASIFAVLVSGNIFDDVLNQVNYLISMMIGSISFIPGAAGAMEAVLLFLSDQNSIETNFSIAVIIVVRLLTLIIPVFIGLISFTILSKRYGSELFKVNK